MNSRRNAEGVEILVITTWRSLEAVRAFTGPDVEQAVIADEDAILLTRWDASVKHYETIFDDVGG